MNQITITKGRTTVTREADGTYSIALDGQKVMIFGQSVASELEFCLTVCGEIAKR